MGWDSQEGEHLGADPTDKLPTSDLQSGLLSEFREFYILKFHTLFRVPESIANGTYNGSVGVHFRFYGGGLTTGDSQLKSWQHPYLLRWSIKYNFVEIVPDYLKLPSRGKDIYEDAKRFCSLLSSGEYYKTIEAHLPDMKATIHNERLLLRRCHPSDPLFPRQLYQTRSHRLSLSSLWHLLTQRNWSPLSRKGYIPREHSIFIDYLSI